MGFLFVGIFETIATQGAVPYLRHIQKLKAMQLERVYITARDHNIDTAERVSYLAVKGNFAKRIKSKRYHAIDILGQRRETILIEMQLIVAPPYTPPEQGRLLET